MSPKPGEIYLVDLGMAGKVRPAVIVSREDPDSPRAIALCVPLTTQNRESAYEVALGKLRFLDKESWAVPPAAVERRSAVARWLKMRLDYHNYAVVSLSHAIHNSAESGLG